MEGFENPEIVAKMEDGRCEANSITDTVPPYFEAVEIFENAGSRAPETWLWFCGPCAEEYHNKNGPKS